MDLGTQVFEVHPVLVGMAYLSVLHNIATVQRCREDWNTD